MRTLFAVALAVCVITACHNDTGETEVWPRAVEPRLSGFSQWRLCSRSLAQGHVVEQARCEATAIEPIGCGDRIDTRARAVRLLLTRETCTDIAIGALQQIASKEPAAFNDLAAAYYVSAQRHDRASDLIRALAALRGAPASPEAQFNRALILEALGLRENAIASWDELLKTDNTAWANEAREHRDALAKKADGETLWERTRTQLDAALRARDRARIAELIKPFQASAQRYLENELLPRKRLDDAALLAAELARFGPDKYPVDVVSKGADPFSLRDRLAKATLVSQSAAPDAFARATAMLAPLERQAKQSGYVHLMARLEGTRAHYLQYQSRYLEAIKASGASVETYERLGDEERAADMHMRQIGLFRWAGAKELACREALIAIRRLDRFVNPGSRHSLFGEAAQTALALGYPEVAMLYQQSAFEFVQRHPELAKFNLPSAFRNRAEVKLHLGDQSGAKADLDEARRLADEGEPNSRRILQARIANILGQRELGRQAIDAFTSALAATNLETHTARADILSRLAVARRNAGDAAGSKRDLQAAIGELDAEEARMLEGRKRGEGEEFWIPYFARFQDIYRRLIRQLLEEGRLEDAFFYAEKARAAEPLDLLHAEKPTLFTRTTLQSKLPRGTLFIEYLLLDDDEAIAWRISRDRFDVVRLGKVDAERWSKAVQRGARFSDEALFLQPLSEGYAALIAPVLRNWGETPERLVIAPDGALHGLPFAALYRDTPRGRRYLVEDAIVEIAGSAQLYLASLRRDEELRSSDNRSALLVGDPAFDKSLPEAAFLEPLPDARLEVEDLRALYPASDVFTEAQATPARVLELAPTRAILHIAAHSLPNADAPFRSVILLAKSGASNGALYAQDLVTKFVRGETRLVVLASCSSAGGLPVGPEGVAPLVRPLIGAGVPAVVGNLWRVNDATARELSVSFHKRYRAGEDAAMALRNAQLDLLRSNKAGLTSARTWGALQVTGHSSSPFAPAPKEKEKPP